MNAFYRSRRFFFSLIATYPLDDILSLLCATHRLVLFIKRKMCDAKLSPVIGTLQKNDCINISIKIQDTEGFCSLIKMLITFPIFHL